MENCIHEIITYILSCFLPSVNKDLQIQQNIRMQMEMEIVEDNLDFLYSKSKSCKKNV